MCRDGVKEETLRIGEEVKMMLGGDATIYTASEACHKSFLERIMSFINVRKLGYDRQIGYSEVPTLADQHLHAHFGNVAAGNTIQGPLT